MRQSMRRHMRAMGVIFIQARQRHYLQLAYTCKIRRRTRLAGVFTGGISELFSARMRGEFGGVLTGLGPVPCSLPHPLSCFVEQHHPRTFFVLPFTRQPRKLLTQERPLRVRHHDGEAPAVSREPGAAPRGFSGVQGQVLQCHIS